MNVVSWLSEHILWIAALYQLIIITVFSIFAARIGHIKTLDDLLPEDSDN